MIYRSKAPLRIGLAGGGTDVSPYCDLYGGAILNASISLYAYASIEKLDTPQVIFEAMDRNERVTYDKASSLPIDGQLDLATGTYNRVVREFGELPSGFRLTTFVDLDPQGAASFYCKAQPPNSKGNARKLIEGKMTLDDVIMDTDYDGFDIIPADRSARKLDIILDAHHGSRKQLKNLLKSVSHTYDFVFIDSPPGFSMLADNIFYASDAVLMPVIPTTLSVRTYEQVKDYFAEKIENPEKLMCFFTLADIRKRMHQEIMARLHEDKRFFEYYIPYLSDIEKMGIHQAPVEAFAPNSYAAICYRALWGEIKEGVLE